MLKSPALSRLIVHESRRSIYSEIFYVLLIFILVIILLGCGESSSSSGSTSNNDLHSISSQMSIAMIECPQRIWPDYSWEDIQVALVDRENEIAFLWNDLAVRSGSQSELSSVDYQQLPSELKYGACGFGELNGFDTMSIAIDSIYDPAALAFHEGFHGYGQSNWAYPYDSGSRVYNYPENYWPRYLRNQIGLSLLNEFTGVDPDGLEKAAYWYRKWLEDHPEELSRFNDVDRTEGSAEYVERISTTIANTSCDISEAQLFAYLKDEIDMDNRYEHMGFYPLSEEPYFLGEISGVLLRHMDKSNWEIQLINGDTPLEILFDGVGYIVDNDNELMLAKVQNYYNDLNEQLRIQLEPLINSWNSRDFFRVSIPGPWQAGSFSVRGEFVNYQNNTEQLVISQAQSGVYATSTGAIIEISDFDIIWSSESPCAIDGDSFPLPKDGFDEGTSDCIDFNSDNLFSSECIGYDILEGNNGERWICLK